MKYLFFILSLCLSVSAFALLKIQPGVYNLEGYLEKDKLNKTMYFVINKRTNARIDLALDGEKVKDVFYKDGQKVKLSIKLNSIIYGAEGQATLIKVIKVIPPSQVVKIYHTEDSLKP